MIVALEDYDPHSRFKEVEIVSFDLNIRQMENLYAIEEDSYVQKLTESFTRNWNDVSLGEQVISETIKFDTNRQQMTQILIQAFHRQIRWTED